MKLFTPTHIINRQSFFTVLALASLPFLFFALLVLIPFPILYPVGLVGTLLYPCLGLPVLLLMLFWPIMKKRSAPLRQKIGAFVLSLIGFVMGLGVQHLLFFSQTQDIPMQIAIVSSGLIITFICFGFGAVYGWCSIENLVDG